MDEPDSWVVARLSSMGDTVLITGVLDYWRRSRGLTFTVLTGESWAPLFEDHPAVCGVEVLSAADLALRRFVPAMKALAARHAGAGLLDLHGTFRTRILAGLWRGPVRRYPKFGIHRRLFLASGGKMFGEVLRRWNVPQRYSLTLERSAPSRDELRPRLFPGPAERERAAALLRPFRVPGAPLAALHPYASHRHKAWPPACWQALAALLEAEGIPWFSVGLGEKIFGPGLPHDLCNRTTLRETCALLEQADVLVTGDSGPMHLAAGVGTPTVAMFGPTCEEWGFFPQGDRDTVLQADMPCRPCSLHGRRCCPYNGECLRRLHPQDVLNAVRRMTTNQIRES